MSNQATNPIKCEKHVMRMIGSEMIYKTRFEFGEPERVVYKYKCSCCGYQTQLETELKGR